VPVLKSGNPKFMQSPYFANAKLRSIHRNKDTQGGVVPDGALQTEQMNKRLRYVIVKR